MPAPSSSDRVRGSARPRVASYTAALLSQTAVPAWNDAHRGLPYVFTGSAAASGAGHGMLVAPVAEAGPARRLAVGGAAAEVVEAGVRPTRDPAHVVKP
ncbi:MAG: hypothetical protein JF597_31180 [Streptomyces sp.]|uniref:hypothetical protein n=1 Tax=Streptomyces sp. TaxID=1931 RepID=UPI0025D5C238|nr:hypothetical protein [Streptomyces sp.]MBW8797887.1 hypothetical protein [Streptomyces sp.]